MPACVRQSCNLCPSPAPCRVQIDNGIPIESWFDDSADEELLHLLPLLKQLITESETAGGETLSFFLFFFLICFAMLFSICVCTAADTVWLN